MDAKSPHLYKPTKPTFWCDVCSLDLQSSASLAQHKLGRKHTKKEFWQSRAAIGTVTTKRPPISTSCQPLHEDELFQGLASGRYSNVVVLTGAGISTAAGIPDFRSPGGVFDTIGRKFGNRFPLVHESPEYVLSRGFADMHPGCAEEIRSTILDPVGEAMSDVMPTAAHKFCAWLHCRGMLKRVYTQNIDGLHSHPSLDVPPELVVECHGSLRSKLVMYGDALPQRFHDCCDADFLQSNNSAKDDGSKVDLLLVFGTSLQVAPFCGVPNLMPRRSCRVLVNRDLDHCITNSFSKQLRCCDGDLDNNGGLRKVTTCRIGSRKHVPLRSLWSSREGNKKWRQLLVEEDCDSFVERFFSSERALESARI